MRALDTMLAFLCWLFIFALAPRTAVAQILKFYGSERVSFDSQDSVHDVEFFDFVTRPDIIAPRWDIKIYDGEALAPGYWFVSPYEIIVQQDGTNRPWVGPHIYDGNGELIWSGTPLFEGWLLNDFRMSNVDGEDMLSGIDQKTVAGILVNNRYEIEREVPIHNDPYKGPNRHDFHTVEDGSKALSMTWNTANASAEELAGIGFEDQPCLIRYGGFQEHDLDTMELLFDWSAEGHIYLNDTYRDTNKACEARFGWDFLHVNSVDKFPDGDYLLSGRTTDGVYKISAEDGSIIWQLGGKRNDFEIDGHFSGQHDARVLSQNSTHTLITMLDNAIRPGEIHITNEFSRGLTLALRTDSQPMTATTLQTFDHPAKTYAPGRGNMQMLEKDNVLLGLWNNSRLAEYSPDGTLLMEAQLIPELRSYRSYKFPWKGYPQTAPDVYAMAHQKDRGDNSAMAVDEVTTFVYASWNGATEIATWALFGTDEQGDGTQLLVREPRNGFETTLSYRGLVDHVVVEALDHDNVILGRSKVFTTIRLPNSSLESVSQEVGWSADASPQTMWTKVENYFSEPPALYVLLGISCFSIITLFVTFIVLGSRTLTMRERRRADQRYEIVQDMDLDERHPTAKSVQDEIDEWG